MKTLLVSLVLLGAVDCKSTPEVNKVNAACTAPAIEKVVGQIVPILVIALLSDDWVSAVSKVVETLKMQGISDALEYVTCAIQLIDGNLVAPSGAALSPQTLAIKAHAAAWLAAHSKVMP